MRAGSARSEARGSPPMPSATRSGPTRALTDAPFMVNLFAWPQPDAAPDAHPSLDEQLAVVVEERVPVFSFTFGIPELRRRA